MANIHMSICMEKDQVIIVIRMNTTDLTNICIRMREVKLLYIR